MNLLCASEIAARQIKVLDIALNSTLSAPRMCRSWRRVSSGARRSRCCGFRLAGKSSFSFSPGCHGFPAPNTQLALARSMAALTKPQDDIHHAADPPAVRGQGL